MIITAGAAAPRRICTEQGQRDLGRENEMFLFSQSGSALFVSAQKTNKTKHNVAALTRTSERQPAEAAGGVRTSIQMRPLRRKLALRDATDNVVTR